MQALLDIEQFFVHEIIVKENPKYKPKKIQEGETNVAFNIKRKGSERLFRIYMTVQVGKLKKVTITNPYHISLKLTGYFRFLEDTDEETISKMISLNGSSILYGVARGVVAQATANCMYGKFILPAINFVELLRKELAKKNTKKRSKKKS